MHILHTHRLHSSHPILNLHLLYFPHSGHILVRTRGLSMQLWHAAFPAESMYCGQLHFVHGFGGSGSCTAPPLFAHVRHMKYCTSDAVVTRLQLHRTVDSLHFKQRTCIGLLVRNSHLSQISRGRCASLCRSSFSSRSFLILSFSSCFFLRSHPLQP